MRKYTYMVLFLIGVSCANQNKESQADYDIELKNSELIEDQFQKRQLTLEQITSQKLKEYFELVQLRNKHPQFKEEIEEQLKSFTRPGILESDKFDVVDISNIRQIGAIVKVSDSVVKLKLIYDKVLNNSTMTDSIRAVILTKNIHLDEKRIVSNEITFERID